MISPGSNDREPDGGGGLALAFGAMRPTTFAPGRFTRVAGFFFFACFGLDFFAGFDFNDDAARFNFPASDLRVEAVLPPSTVATPPLSRSNQTA